jgi:uncharacterized BrkB/YihY/UPF0761 family membrane protein
VRTLSDQARFTIWFFILSGVLGLFVAGASSLRNTGWAAVIPVWLVISTAFWLWTPRYLLRGNIALRPLLPGALLATLVIGVATATSRYFVGSELNSDSRHFGAFGVVIALLAWAYSLATISLVCAVFSPVWAEWRQNEKTRAEAPATRAESAASRRAR